MAFALHREPEPYTVMMTFGPAEAREFLDKHNFGTQRNVRELVVQRYADDMANGRWIYTGTPIQVGTDGSLLDGQHRLLAIVESGARLKFDVRYNIDPAAMTAIDIGAIRGLGDFLKMRGITKPTHAAAIINKLWRWDHRGTFVQSTGTVGDKATIQQALRYAVDHEDELREAVRFIQRPYMSMFGWGTTLATVYTIFSRIDREDAEHFFGKFLTGAGLPPESVILNLRNRLTELRNSVMKPRSQYIAAITIKAWNAFREGTSVKVLTWRSGGASPEIFPQPL